MNGLKISDDLSLPADRAATETYGILAVRGAGKSNTAAVMAEQMYAAKIPFVIVDPMDNWWGLRSSRDGKGAGLAIPIFGGRKKDIPLERHAGEEVARLIADKRLSCVLSLTEFSEGDKTRFLTEFAKELYRRNEHPLHLFLEEADDYIPQKPSNREAELLRAWQDIVRRGRARGLGMTLITQRSAVIHKDVLTQIGTLIVMRTISPWDRKAIQEWLKYHGESHDILESLPGLADGEAWVWSPTFLRCTKRVKFFQRATFDSAATPKSGSSPKAVTTLADINLVELRERFAETIEKAKADDPDELRSKIRERDRRITELERELVKARSNEKLDGLVLIDSDRDSLNECIADMLNTAQRLSITAEEARKTLVEASDRATNRAPARKGSPIAAISRTPARPATVRAIVASGDASVGTGGLRRILTALVHRPHGLSVRQIGVRARMKTSGGSFRTYLSRARTSGWIEGDRSLFRITAAGVAALGPVDPEPTGRELYEQWLGELGQSGTARILTALYETYPRAMTKAQLADSVGMNAGGGSFSTYLSRLRALELIEGKGELRASGELLD